MDFGLPAACLALGMVASVYIWQLGRTQRRRMAIEAGLEQRRLEAQAVLSAAAQQTAEAKALKELMEARLIAVENRINLVRRVG